MERAHPTHPYSTDINRNVIYNALDAARPQIRHVRAKLRFAQRASSTSLTLARYTPEWIAVGISTLLVCIIVLLWLLRPIEPEGAYRIVRLIMRGTCSIIVAHFAVVCLSSEVSAQRVRNKLPSDPMFAYRGPDEPFRIFGTSYSFNGPRLIVCETELRLEQEKRGYRPIMLLIVKDDEQFIPVVSLGRPIGGGLSTSTTNALSAFSDATGIPVEHHRVQLLTTNRINLGEHGES